MNKKDSEKLLETLERLGKIIDPTIKEVLTLEIPEEFHDLTIHQINAGGKRLRPAFLFTSCYLLGGKTKDAIYPATGVEILHNYTLIVDDIIDNSLTRRGKPTVWKKYGTSMAECAGSFYASSIFEAAQRSRHPLITSQIFSKTLKTIMVGEINDVLCDRGEKKNEPFVKENKYPSVDKKVYLNMIYKKTASLFESCCALGGICANGKKEDIKLLKEFGLNLGLAFQIQDDILDIFGDPKKFGKKIGKDIQERKGGNIVILYALEELNQKDKKELLSIINKPKIFNRDIERGIELIKKTDAKAKAEKLGNYYNQKSKKVLKKLPQNEWNQIMEFLSDFTMQRNK